MCVFVYFNKGNWLEANGSEATKFLRYLYCKKQGTEQAKPQESQISHLAETSSACIPESEEA